LESAAEKKTDDALYCAACGHLVTRERWRTSRDGHEHKLINPLGQVFNVQCFEDAPGAGLTGEPTSQYTWFAGYRWQIALCRICDAHLGWRYISTGQSGTFFGLIKEKLITSSNKL